MGTNFGALWTILECQNQPNACTFKTICAGLRLKNTSTVFKAQRPSMLHSVVHLILKAEHKSVNTILLQKMGPNTGR